MILPTIEAIRENQVKEFYNPESEGVLIIRGTDVMSLCNRVIHHLQKKEFILKDHQHINNGQAEYLFSSDINEDSAIVQAVLGVYKKIQEKLGVVSGGIIDCSASVYPISQVGASLRQDFSYNKNCILTIFLGETEFLIARSKDGQDIKYYQVFIGDIVVMRAPRVFTTDDKNVRPIHGIGKVEEVLFTLEVREVFR